MGTRNYIGGFSLIELITVIGIVGLLAAVAVPSYKAYVTKAKMSRVVTTFDVFKNKIVEYYNVRGQLPAATVFVPDAVNSQLVANNFFGANSNNGLAQQLRLRNLWYGYDTTSFTMHAYFEDAAFGDANVDGKIMQFTGTVRSDGIWTFKCGSGGTDSIFIQPPYLPPGCNEVLY